MYSQYQFHFPSSHSSSSENLSLSDLHPQAESLLHKAKIPEKYNCEKILYQSPNSTLFLCYEEENIEKKVLKIGNTSKQTKILKNIGNNSHIVQVQDYGQNWFLMPYYSGTLSRIIEKNVEPLPIETIQELLHDVSEALLLIHKKGIIHGDVKSDNVLFKEGQDLKKTFFLCDFGISFSQEDKITTPTQTLAYRYPNKIENDKCRVDIWGLGCILFECLTGTTLLPLEIQSESEYQQAIETNTTKQHIKKQLVRWSSKKHLDTFEEKLLRFLQRGGCGKGEEQLVRMLGVQ